MVLCWYADREEEEELEGCDSCVNDGEGFLFLLLAARAGIDGRSLVIKLGPVSLCGGVD